MTDLDFDREFAYSQAIEAQGLNLYSDDVRYEALRRLKRLRELIVEGEVLYQGYTEKLYGIVEPSFSVDIAKEIRELLNIKET